MALRFSRVWLANRTKKNGPGDAETSARGQNIRSDNLPMTEAKHSHANHRHASPVPLEDGHLCSESCPYLVGMVDGSMACEADNLEPLHPSFEALPIDGKPRSERCTECLVSELLARGDR
jgi:hypothetical protein